MMLQRLKEPHFWMQTLRQLLEDLVEDLMMKAYYRHSRLQEAVKSLFPFAVQKQSMSSLLW